MKSNNILYVIIAIIVLAVAAYGGFRVWRHYTRPQAPVAPATSAPVPQPAPAGTTAGNSVYKMTNNTQLGNFLTDLKGMTLYTFSKDTAGVSNCSGQCLANWPAYVAPSKTGPFPTNVSVITRSDGTLQYAWKGMPVYFYIGDKAAGDTTGQGVGGVWYVAK